MSTTAETQISEVPGSQGDIFLRSLVDLVTGTEKSIPITLTVGGLLVTGELVSGHRYFSSKEQSNSSKDTAERDLDDYMEMWSKKYTDRDDQAPMPVYLHIQHAVFILGGSRVKTSGSGFWRGRITAGDGFILGRADLDAPGGK